jgi:hypothetical protein
MTGTILSEATLKAHRKFMHLAVCFLHRFKVLVAYLASFFNLGTVVT